MPRFCPLFSSSEGNCTYISASDGALLVDAGVSCKSILQALNDKGADLKDIRGILVTHSHSDHVRSLKTICSKLGIPVYATEQTLSALAEQDKLCPKCKTYAVDAPFSAAGMEITPFRTSHDCEGSAGYLFKMPGGVSAAVCTDLGVMTDSVRNTIKGADAVLIESNHDVNMLKNGPYPPELKLRILSDRGHLSNVACASELPELLKSGTTRFILGHLSQHNNLPEIAKNCSEVVLIGEGAVNLRDYILYVAPPKNGEMFYL